MSDDRQSCLRQAATTEEMLSALYVDLRRLAAAKMRHEGRGHTLQATALVHEAFLRLSRNESVWESKGHFFAAAAEAMRRILIEDVRRKRACKNGGDRIRIAISDENLPTTSDDQKLIDLDDALTQLSELDARAAKIAELRIFAGLTIQELAEFLQMPQTTAFREWTFARAWLKARLGLDSEDSASDEHVVSRDHDENR
jgi:RNA polymerase sigma factor (TIGR02999 family)